MRTKKNSGALTHGTSHEKGGDIAGHLKGKNSHRSKHHRRYRSSVNEAVKANNRHKEHGLFRINEVLESDNDERNLGDNQRDLFENDRNRSEPFFVASEKTGISKLFNEKNQRGGQTHLNSIYGNSEYSEDYYELADYNQKYVRPRDFSNQWQPIVRDRRLANTAASRKSNGNKRSVRSQINEKKKAPVNTNKEFNMDKSKRRFSAPGNNHRPQILRSSRDWEPEGRNRRAYYDQGYNTSSECEGNYGAERHRNYINEPYPEVTYYPDHYSKRQKRRNRSGGNNEDEDDREYFYADNDSGIYPEDISPGAKEKNPERMYNSGNGEVLTQRRTRRAQHADNVAEYQFNDDKYRLNEFDEEYDRGFYENLEDPHRYRKVHSPGRKGFERWYGLEGSQIYNDYENNLQSNLDHYPTRRPRRRLKHRS